MKQRLPSCILPLTSPHLWASVSLAGGLDLNFVLLLPEALREKAPSHLWCASPDTFTDLWTDPLGTCGPAHPRTACGHPGEGKAQPGRRLSVSRMHLRAP